MNDFKFFSNFAHPSSERLPPAADTSSSSCTICSLAPGQPSLMAQMASTVASVAVGSAVGHALGHTNTRGFRGGGNAEPAKPDITYQEPQGAQLQNQRSFGPCSLEIKQFLECAQNQSDIKLCEGFNEVLYLFYLHFKCYRLSWFPLRKPPIPSSLPVLTNPIFNKRENV
uniref:Uncharacterized protein n=1 Tax=Mus spicilegus TaxID=10103 RepID=A0A8C6GPP1_MUSSI